MAKPPRSPNGRRRDQDLTPAVLRFLLSHVPEGIGRAHLLKLTYMVDLEARRFLGRPITRLNYTWRHGGPFDRSFEGHIEALKSKGIIAEETVRWPSGPSAGLYTFIGNIEPTPFTPAEEHLLAYVARSYSTSKMGALIEELVDGTEPVRLARKSNRIGVRLAMSRLDNQGRREFGNVDLEKLLEGEAQMRAGIGRELDDVRRELLGPPDE